MLKKFAALLVTLSCFGCAGSLGKIENLYNSSIGSIVEAERLLDQIDERITQKNYGNALALCNEVVEKYGSTPTLGEDGISSYGEVAGKAKQEVLCLQRKEGQPVFTSKANLAGALKSALQAANPAQIEKLLTCGIGRATPKSDHTITFDTVNLAQELASLRRANGAPITFNSRGTDFIFTEGYTDGKMRRFALAYEKATNEWYVESFIEGPKLEVEALPETLIAAVPALTPEQQQQLRQDFALYTDPNGLLVSEPNPGINTSGNGLLYTGYYYMTLKLYGILTDADSQKFEQTVQACRKDGINGLYNRTPTKTDQEGPDDYYGIVSAASANYLNAPMSTDVYRYGNDTRVDLVNWVLNNESPGQFSLSAWLGRMPQFVAHCEMAAGKRPAIWRRAVWLSSVQLSDASNPDGNQSIVLTWLRAATIAPRMRAMKLVAKDFRKRVMKNYPRGMKDVFAIYFNNPDHPLAKWAVTNYGWE